MLKSQQRKLIQPLRASGFKKSELIRHYMAMPVIVMIIAAIVGNVLGYTLLKGYMVAMYYGSYSLPTYVTRWNADALVKTMVIPLLIMVAVNLLILIKKMQITPLQFLRRELTRKKKGKAFRLNSKIKILKRFEIRVILSVCFEGTNQCG